MIVVSDDGRGIDFDRLRAVIIERALAAPDVAATLSEAELLEFLFLPGFTLKATVTEVSGRGVGLDVVQTMARQMSGSVRVAARAGAGVEFQLHLPLTLTVVRAIIAELGGEPYGFPLSRVAGVLQVRASAVESIEGRQHALFRGERLGLVAAAQVLGLADPPADSDDISVIVLGERGAHVGLVVDRLVGDAELVTRPLDPRLGKLKDIASAALMPDGSPVLVVDIEDLRRSVEHLVSGGGLARCAAGAGDSTQARRTRLLVVDDSLTVRELERKLLVAAGYEVEVAVDGMDGWNAVRTGGYDLVVTDVDMPRVDGIELVTLIRRDPKLQSLPVMIVSYKDRDEDRRRGLEAGADYYLAKANFHDNVLLDAVRDLIGAAR